MKKKPKNNELLQAIKELTEEVRKLREAYPPWIAIPYPTQPATPYEAPIAPFVSPYHTGDFPFPRTIPDSYHELFSVKGITIKPLASLSAGTV